MAVARWLWQGARIPRDSAKRRFPARRLCVANASRPAVSGAGIRVMAHEVGHDMTGTTTGWPSNVMMSTGQLELKADGIAVLTLQRVGIDTERLVSAVQKWTRYNQLLDADQRPAAIASALAADARYVPLKERVTFIRAVARLHWAGGSRRAMPPWSHKCRQRTLATPMERIEHLTSCGQGFCH